MWADGSLFNGAHPIDESSCSKAQSRRRDFIELSGIYALILLVIWTPRPYQKLLWCLAAIIAIWVIAISFEGFHSMGLCTANLRRSLWCVGLAAALALAAVALANRLHTLHTPTTLASGIWHYIGYALWATVQEIMLQCFFLVRSLRLMKNASLAAVFSACLFSVAHLPNPVLAVITLVFGAAACLFYLHYRNVWPLAAAHALLGIAIAVTIPANLDHNMRVGVGYLTYVDQTAVAGNQLMVNRGQ
ncbi:MAG TPA: CPBP family intramembrane glutamic endopeptidase [Terracidiphilus sp.]|jgi:membrane protease YdiL (CAAX protease family)|nr:CPBP family intramembrane glutamic endopeptidase [Terracidiphilus sp.]